MKRKSVFLLMLFLLVGLLIGTQSYAVQSVPYNWKNVAMGGGGFVSSVIAAPNDPGVFYARTDVGGAYSWDDGEKRWIPLLDWVSSEDRGYLGVDGIAVDPGVKGRVYMLLGIGYFSNGRSAFVRSDDYGKTWDVFDVTDKFKAHGNGMGRGNGERVAVDPNNGNIILVGSRQNGLWKSTDRGATWKKLSLDYTPDPSMNRDMHESGVCTLQFDANDVSGGATRTIYAGISRETKNVYVSHNGGASWSLVEGQPTAGKIRPQRIALTPDGRYLYVTYGNGAGPHPMLWSGVTDYFNRGAVYKCDTQEGTWTDISPENFMENLNQITNDEYHRGAYSGISIDPNDPERILATAINSWRGPQFWNIDGTWKDAWGDNIYLSEDGGATWREMFRYYHTPSGYVPDYEMVSENGFPWIVGAAIHWNGAVTFDPFNSERAFVASGNGVFATDNLSDAYTSTDWVDNVQKTSEHGQATWKFSARGIEETVPLGMVSLPGGALVSVIGDYDGFVNEDLDKPSPNGQLSTIVNGQAVHLGSTTGLDFAFQKPNVLAKAAGNKATAYGQEVSICGVTISNDGGKTWDQTYNPPSNGDFKNGQVAVSADGTVVLWAPNNGDSPYNGLFRYVNSGWSQSQGVSFNCNPEADKANPNLIYAYNRADGYLYVSEDKGATFARRGSAGTSDYNTIRSAPGIEGEIWIPLSYAGLTRTSDAGKTFTKVNGVTWCEAVGFGKAQQGKNFPTVFIYGTVDNVTGIFRSTDQGGSWVRVNDDAHQFGGPGNASAVIGDLNVFGRVFMSTAGRGVVYGDPGSGGPVTPANTDPTANLSASVVSGEAPLSVTFNASGSSDPDGDSLTYTWNFGDGSRGTGVSQSHTYTAAGVYNVTLTVRDGQGGNDTASIQIEVKSSGDTDTNSDTDTGSGTDTGSETGSETGTDSGSDTDTNTDDAGCGWPDSGAPGCGS